MSEVLTHRVEISRVENEHIVIVDFAKPQIPVEKPERADPRLFPSPFKAPETIPATRPIQPYEEPIKTPRTPVPAHR